MYLNISVSLYINIIHRYKSCYPSALALKIFNNNTLKLDLAPQTGYLIHSHNSNSGIDAADSETRINNQILVVDSEECRLGFLP